MTPTRRVQIVRLTTQWVARLVDELPEVDNGLYEILADGEDFQAEQAVAIDTCHRIADSIRKRVRA